MEKEFVSYEQALALKELGFNDKCIMSYLGESLFLNPHNNSMATIGYISAPIKQQAFRWFREKYDIHHIVIWDSETNNFDAGLFGELVIPFLEEDAIFTAYEEAENACIDKLIELTKTK